MIEGFGAQGERFFVIDLGVSRGLVRVVLGSDFKHTMEPKCVQNVAWGHLGAPGGPKCLVDDFGRHFGPSGS